VPRRNAIGTARKVFVVLAWAFVLAVAIQFPILVLIAAVFGLMGRAVIGMTIGVFVLVFLQRCSPRLNSTPTGSVLCTC
jgi:Na+(H+)/acetate symporter ActP